MEIGDDFADSCDNFVSYHDHVGMNGNKTCHICNEKDAVIKSLQDHVANFIADVSTLEQNIKTPETKVTYQSIERKR